MKNCIYIKVLQSLQNSLRHCNFIFIYFFLLLSLKKKSISMHKVVLINCLCVFVFFFKTCIQRKSINLQFILPNCVYSNSCVTTKHTKSIQKIQWSFFSQHSIELHWDSRLDLKEQQKNKWKNNGGRDEKKWKFVEVKNVIKILLLLLLW